MGGASMGGPSSMSLPAPYGVAISLRGDRADRGDITSLRGDVSPARPTSREPRSSNNTHSSQHTSPATSPYGSPMDLGATPPMPPMHGALPPPSSHYATLRQPLPVIAEPSYADVARYAESGIHPQGQQQGQQQGHQQGHQQSSESAQHVAQHTAEHTAAQQAEPHRGAAGAAGAAGAPLVIEAREGRQGREGEEAREGREASDSTEQLLLSSSPPSESLFPFAPTPNT